MFFPPSSIQIFIFCHSNEPLIHLNYAVLLNDANEREAAVKQFQHYKKKAERLRAINNYSFDKEVCNLFLPNFS